MENKVMKPRIEYTDSKALATYIDDLKERAYDFGEDIEGHIYLDGRTFDKRVLNSLDVYLDPVIFSGDDEGFVNLISKLDSNVNMERLIEKNVRLQKLKDERLMALELNDPALMVITPIYKDISEFINSHRDLLVEEAVKQHQRDVNGFVDELYNFYGCDSKPKEYLFDFSQMPKIEEIL